MKKEDKVMAAIAAAVDMYQQEEAQATAAKPRSQLSSNWKYWGVGEMMRMRTLWQLRLCSPASHVRR